MDGFRGLRNPHLGAAKGGAEGQRNEGGRYPRDAGRARD
jgi:hypothetical protein